VTGQELVAPLPWLLVLVCAPGASFCASTVKKYVVPHVNPVNCFVVVLAEAVTVDERLPEVVP
jgi:hypothetical protein